jgi:RNA polymerase sigma-70 factor (ECF subfamily)
MGRSEQDEAQLIRRAKAGDCDAFAEIYDRCYRPIFRHILYRVPTAATAEDLAGEVFVRMVESIDDFTYRGRPLLAWLYTIAGNLISTYYRRAGRAPTVALGEELSSMVADVPDPEAVANLKLDQERLAAAMRGLTDEQRQVIELKFYQGLDNITVAQILGKSYGAVKALQHRGLAALRDALK